MIVNYSSAYSHFIRAQMEHTYATHTRAHFCSLYFFSVSGTVFRREIYVSTKNRTLRDLRYRITDSLSWISKRNKYKWHNQRFMRNKTNEKKKQYIKCKHQAYGGLSAVFLTHSHFWPHQTMETNKEENRKRSCNFVRNFVWFNYVSCDCISILRLLQQAPV